MGKGLRYAALSLSLLLLACDADETVTSPDTQQSDTLPEADAAVDVPLADSALEVTGDVPEEDTGADIPEEDTGADIPEEDTAQEPDQNGAEIAVDPAFEPDFDGYAPDVVVTTVLQTWWPKYGFGPYISDQGALLVPEAEFGRLYPQPGEPHVVRDDLGVGESEAEQRRSLLYFLLVADGQVPDTESPAAIAANDIDIAGFSVSAYLEHFPLQTHMMDAAIQTASRFGSERSFDFAIHAGDVACNAQQNEINWSIALLQGDIIDPDTGADDDPAPGPVNDPWDAYRAGGLPPATPWYVIIGNHDINVNGVFPPGLIEALNGPDVVEQMEALLAMFNIVLPGVGTDAYHRNFLPVEETPAFLVDPAHFQLDVLFTAEDLVAYGGAEIVPDGERAFVDVCGFVALHRESQGEPAGHGFTAENLEHCTGFYRAELGPGFRLLALDTGPHIGGSSGSLTPPLMPDGSVDPEKLGDVRYDQVAWLEAELQQADADGVAVLVAAHHASASLIEENQLEDIKTLLSEYPEIHEIAEQWLVTPEEAVNGAEFRALLANHPSVVAHIAGHWHKNAIRAVCPGGSVITEAESESGQRCPTPGGYYEIVTASPGDYPGQVRIVEIVDNGDGTGSIYATMVEPPVDPTSLFERGRVLHLAKIQATTGKAKGPGHRLARNVELKVRWSDPVQQTLAGVEAPTKIESLTTLQQPAPGLPRLPLPVGE